MPAEIGRALCYVDRKEGSPTAVAWKNSTRRLALGTSSRPKPGGRLVAVVGQGMALERPSFACWWQDIFQRYAVRANVGIDGNEYAKFSTTLDNQVLGADRLAIEPAF